ncbi:MspA family porin [Nocardia concava]|uniref:MspA family porin n=1 Tax=Nocardia concava TaxID=257281 RepID=UPI00030FAB45|nr:MspA family porin [Nocardia concava]
MSENRTAGLRRAARIAGVGAAASVALGLMSTGAANADTFVPLPDGHKAGPGVTIDRLGEHAVISPSLSANGAGRTAWLSGRVIANVDTPEGTVGPNNGPTNSPGSNNSSTHGTSQVNTGYIIGCQVNISDSAVSAGVSGGVSLTGANAGGSIGLNLGPGQVTFVQVQSKDITKSGTYAIDYKDVPVDVQGCAGYAQARAYTVVEVIGDNYSKTTLYGQPFSLG